MLNLLRFRFRFGERNRNGVLLDIPEDAELSSIETFLHMELRPYFLSADLVLLRFPPWEMREPEPRSSEREGITRISRRFPNSAVRILSSYKYQHVIGENLSKTYEEGVSFEADARSFIDELRNTELIEMIKQSNALLTAGDNYMFHLPSGALSNYFVRAGNIQTGRHNLDTLFFWMLPYLADVDGILVDTWSIGSIALNCSRLIGRYASGGRKNLRVEMRSSYVDGRPDTGVDLADLAERISHGWNSPFLSLISVAMTGRSIINLCSALQARGCPSELIRLLVLFSREKDVREVNNITVPELCQLNLEEKIDEPNEGITTIEIDRTTYFPVFIKEKEVGLIDTLAGRNESFFTRYECSKAIQVHRNSLVDGQFYRHHGIYIDVQKLLQTNSFRERLTDILTKIKKAPQIIVVPPHDAGKNLAHTIANYFGEKGNGIPHVVLHLDLSYPTSGEFDDQDQLRMQALHVQLRSLKETDSIMIVDDVVTTGERLLAYQKRLRDIEYKGEIDYLIGVQRMPSREDYKVLSSTLSKNNLGDPHRVACVDEVVLPNWDDMDCPLCVEERFLGRLFEDSSSNLSHWTKERWRYLSNTISTGVADEVFLASPDSPALRLTINSYFASENAPQAVVLSSVAAAIQELRTYEKLDGRLDSKGFPVRTVFKVRDFERYSDGILRASILRSLKPEELRSVSRERRASLVSLGEALFGSDGDDERNTRPELALAIGLGKLPRDFASDATREKLKDLNLHDLVEIMDGGRV